ncbi:MAG: UDP-N-acetylglucosamine 2-epimerase [Nitrospirae bacterium]|nr:UDP-N-acetylglucosamine 2-epimerase [Nitrospirota bacterium]
MIYIVIGTKAQFIKMAPIMVEMMNRKVPFRYISTGQHQETMRELHGNFGVRDPDIRLYEGKDVTSVFSMFLWSLGILKKVFFNKKAILQQEKKGIVLVHGDTFSTLLGALMGKLLKLKVAHIESGLRSFHLFHPFPEEMTRILTFSLTDYYFCPGPWALKNVEKYKGVKVDTTSNTLYDALKSALESEGRIDVDIPDVPYAIATIHRYENIFHKEKLTAIIDLIKRVSQKVRVLFILHPPTRNNLVRFGLYDVLTKCAGVELRPRYDYFEFIKLIRGSEFMISDGGSNQEESYYMGHPCLLLRKATERMEGLGKNVVLSMCRDSIISEFLGHYKKYKAAPVVLQKSPSKIIVDSLLALRSNYAGKTEVLNNVEYTEEYFKKEFLRNEEKRPHFQDKVRNVMELAVPISRGDVILDIGTCSGTFAFECGKYSNHVYGVDLSRNALLYCLGRRKELSGDHVEFLQCTADNLPFKGASFDKIVMGDIAEHLPNDVFHRTIDEVRRLLKTGGALIIYTPNRDHLFERLKARSIILKADPTHINLMTKRQMQDSLREKGFSIQKSYYKPSHFLFFNLLENVFMRIPALSKYFGRRICLVGVKE